MSMSKDRIEFTLKRNSFHKLTAVDAFRIANAALGLTQAEFNSVYRDDFSHLRLRVRPSQFGRFIVMRVEAGMPNNPIRELDPKIIPAEKYECVLDLSNRPARHVD